LVAAPFILIGIIGATVLWFTLRAMAPMTR
jgi:hypothetical protein